LVVRRWNEPLKPKWLKWPSRWTLADGKKWPLRMREMGMY
jgi:hypothetical protein